MCLFVGDCVGSYSGKGQRWQRSVYWKSGVCVDGEFVLCLIQRIRYNDLHVM